MAEQNVVIRTIHPNVTDVVQMARVIAEHDPKSNEEIDFAAIPACTRLKLDKNNAAKIFAAANDEIRALGETLRGG